MAATVPVVASISMVIIVAAVSATAVTAAARTSSTAPAPIPAPAVATIIPTARIATTVIIPAPTRSSGRSTAAPITSTGRILGQRPKLKRDHQVLPRRHDLGLKRLVPRNGAQPRAGSRAAQGIGSRGDGVYHRVGERVAELEADRGAWDRQAVGVGQLDDQRGGHRLAHGGTLVIAAHDGKGGGNALAGARQRQILATAGQGEYRDGQCDRALPHSGSE
jgi:hypothetical protein